ncbi:unnamed protein product [Nezara viridula]|uniref:Uncharacterized protein n=1 Tax=Nezara viridula TaxID=85310 RepID=A0A9P0E4L3_NEZVI|nr:unnamed protein product [Nezara viridula]
MDWYPREHVRKRGRPPTDWDKEMKKTYGREAWKRVALERKEWKRMGQVHYLVWSYVDLRLPAAISIHDNLTPGVLLLVLPHRYLRSIAFLVEYLFRLLVVLHSRPCPTCPNQQLLVLIE